jgi:cyclic pyranopterin phosphate synthase
MREKDRFGREISYLRVSVTDRCNFRCFYCRPVRDFTPLPHSEILSYEEILEVVRAGVAAGVKKVRLTGGEPLLRRGIAHLVKEIAAMPEIQDLGLTTNGLLLETMAWPLREAGLTRLNVSLDSLDPAVFQRVTGKDAARQVLAGIEAALSLGFAPVKLNTVAVAGVNDADFGRLARLSMDWPVHVRFIEFMPTAGVTDWASARFLSWERVKEIVERDAGALEQVPESGLFPGPALRYRFPGAKGEVGFITAVTRHFCGECNRMRLTADGKLRPCLLSDREVDVRAGLRAGLGEEAVLAAWKRALELKPQGHALDNPERAPLKRGMSRIGG